MPAHNDKPPRRRDALRDITLRIGEEEMVVIVVYTVEEAARALKISRWKIFDLIRTKQLGSVKIGGLRRIPHKAIEEYIARLMEEVV